MPPSKRKLFDEKIRGMAERVKLHLEICNPFEVFIKYVRLEFITIQLCVPYRHLMMMMM